METLPQLKDDSNVPIPLLTVGESTMIAPGSRSATAPLWPTIPGYQIDGELGEGGMGSVYRARQVRANRVVALKTIREQRVLDEDTRRRFTNEAQAIAALDHPYVVKVFDVGEADDLPYFALEYCPNGSLQPRFIGTPWDPREAAITLEKIARGVGAAHAKEIVHRDLKPANVLLTAENEPKVTDFGLAKRLDHDESHTQAGTFMGTPDYMAPEQTYYLDRPITPATDVFSLGVMFYQMLSGVLPFWASSRAEKLYRTVHFDPISLRSINPLIPRDLETICTKCLEKEPSHRYVNAGEVADELRRFLEGKATLARPAGRFEKCIRWVRRNPLPAAFAGFFVASFVAVTLLAVFAVRASSEAKKNEALARENALRADDEKFFNRLLSAGSYFQLQNYPAMRQALDAIPARSRHWEWAYLDRINPLVQEWRDHREEITCLATDLKRTRLVTGSRDKTVKVWDPVAGQLIASLRERDRPIWSVALHPHMTLVALGGEGGNLWLWDYSTDQVRLDRRTSALDGETISAVAFSLDGKWLASGGWNKTIEIRDVQHPETVVHTLKGHADVIDGLAFVGNTLVSASWDGSVRLWDAHEGKQTGVLVEGLGKVLALAASPTADEVLLSLDNHSISLWDMPTRKKIRDYRDNRAPSHTIGWSADGKRFAIGSKDRTVTLRDRDNPDPLAVFRVHAAEVRGVAFHPTEPRLFSAGFDHLLRSTSLNARPSETPFDGMQSHARRVTSLALTDHWLASVSMDASLKVWDRRTGQLKFSCPHELGREKYLWAVAVSPDGSELATAGDGGMVWIWDAEQGTLKTKLGPARPVAISSLVWSPDGKTVIAGEHGGTVRRWDRASQEHREFREVQGNIESLALSRSGRYLASGSWDSSIGLYDLHDGNRFIHLKEHRDTVGGLAFSPDERYLASASSDGTVRVWEVAAGKPVARIDAGGGQVYCVAWSPDSTRLVYGAQNGEMKLWNAERREESITLSANGEPVKTVRWSDDGECLYSGDWKGTIRVWRGSLRRE